MAVLICCRVTVCYCLAEASHLSVARSSTHTLTPRPASLCVRVCVCACFVGFLIGQTLISLRCTWAKPRQQQRPNQPTAVAGLVQGIVIVIVIAIVMMIIVIMLIIIVIDWARQTAPAPAHIALRRHLHFPLYAHTQSPLYINKYVGMLDILSYIYFKRSPFCKSM